MGLLPCPLIIIVVGSAIYRGAALAGIVLAVGINIGCFGLLGDCPTTRWTGFARRQHPSGPEGSRLSRVADLAADPHLGVIHRGRRRGPRPMIMTRLAAALCPITARS